jgi:DNA-binding transcriptional ArsR family regulator
MVESLDAVFHALSSEPRRAMLNALATREQTVGDLAQPFDISLAAVSKHLKVLEGAGLVSRIVEGRRHMLRLETRALGEASDWLELHRSLWERKFAAVEEHLAEQEAKR